MTTKAGEKSSVGRKKLGASRKYKTSFDVTQSS